MEYVYNNSFAVETSNYTAFAPQSDFFFRPIQVDGHHHLHPHLHHQSQVQNTWRNENVHTNQHHQQSTFHYKPSNNDDCEIVSNVVINTRDYIPESSQDALAFLTTNRRADHFCPPNITVTPETSIPSHLLQQMVQQPAGGSHQDHFGGFVKVPVRRKDSRTRKPPAVVESSEPNMSSFENVLSWMEKNDTNMSDFDNCYMKNTVSELLENPDIVNNQSSSFTKSVYALKGFTRDFTEIRTKSKIELSDLSRELSKLNGDQIPVQRLSDFENLLLPIENLVEVCFLKSLRL